MGTEGIKDTCRLCGSEFTMCLRCWRGHAYCSDDCKEKGYDKTRQAARDNYAKSPKGKINHAERQRRYRLRNREDETIEKM